MSTVQTETVSPATFRITPESQLRRFLVLGTNQGVVSFNHESNVMDNMRNVLNMVRKDGDLAINLAVEYSVEGRIPRNDTALLVLAAALTAGTSAQKRRVSVELPKVARTGTHILTFVSMVEQLRGWGKAAKRAVANWYASFESADRLAYQLVKYANRSGWTHVDALRVSHLNPTRLSAPTQATLKWLVKGIDCVENRKDLPAILTAIEGIENKSAGQVSRLIREHGLPHEVVPNDLKRMPEIWEALLPSMGVTALIRNLGRFGNIGLLERPEFRSTVINTLLNEEALRRGRVHPLLLLNALYTYNSGAGVRGSLRWDVDKGVAEALEASFYKSFDQVEPTGKRFLLGVDVSGSMSALINQTSALTHADVAAVMAMLTVRTEPHATVLGFARSVVDLEIEPTDSISEVRRKTSIHNFGSTNCGALIQFASRLDLPIDVFSVYTDNDHNTGSSPSDALRVYRKKFDVGSKLISVSTLASYKTIADPDDPGMLDVVGFDTTLPNIIESFVRM